MIARLLLICAVFVLGAGGVVGKTTHAFHHLLVSSSSTPLAVVGVAVNASSAKIDIQPVPGAQDYRVYDESNPTVVKYGGLRHLQAPYGSHFVMQSDGMTPVYPFTYTANTSMITQPVSLTVANPEVEWNNLADGQPHTLIAQAVDQLGPAPFYNLSSYSDTLANSTPAAGTPLPLPPTLGANKGIGLDGLVSINGQGAVTDTPQVIAQSEPFSVTANGLLPLPSSADATQVFMDPFLDSEDATIATTGIVNNHDGTSAMTQTMGIAPTLWDILWQNADTTASMSMVRDGHFMNILFDGGTTSTDPLTTTWHIKYASLSLSPQPPAAISRGQMLHLTEEVDAHLDSAHRWLSFELAPAGDPITNFKADDGAFDNSGGNTSAINQSNQALWVQTIAQNCDATLFIGPKANGDPGPQAVPITAFTTTQSFSHASCINALDLGGNGLGLDDRSRFDLFVTTQHFALFEDAHLLEQGDIPGGLPFNQVKVYFTTYLYNLVGAPTPPLQLNPWDAYWGTVVPYSDERHWDNVGMEVLPASDVPADWSTLVSRIHMPVFTTPVPADSPTPGATPTATMTPKIINSPTPQE